MPKEYRTIQEVAGPLMLVRGVENVAYDELGEIELASGEKRRCLFPFWGDVLGGFFSLYSSGPVL